MVITVDGSTTGLATGGFDFKIDHGYTEVFPPDHNSSYIGFLLMRDSLHEEQENFMLRLYNAGATKFDTGRHSSTTVHILDKEGSCYNYNRIGQNQSGLTHKC